MAGASAYKEIGRHVAGPVGRRVLVQDGSGQRRLADLVAAGDEQASALARNAFRARSSASSRAVVAILETSWTEGGDYCQVTDLKPEARSLKDMGSLIQVSERQILPVVINFLDAIKDLHRNGLVHSAICPQTVYWEGESARLGELWWLHDTDGEPFDPSLKGGFIKSLPAAALPFTAPELFYGQGPSRQSDMYSLGAMMYYVLTVCPPKDLPDSGAEDLRAMAAAPATYIQDRLPALSDRMAGLIHSLLDQDPDNRPGLYRVEAAMLYMAALPVSAR